MSCSKEATGKTEASKYEEYLKIGFVVVCLPENGNVVTKSVCVLCDTPMVVKKSKY